MKRTLILLVLVIGTSLFAGEPKSATELNEQIAFQLKRQENLSKAWDKYQQSKSLIEDNLPVNYGKYTTNPQLRLLENYISQVEKYQEECSSELRHLNSIRNRGSHIFDTKWDDTSTKLEQVRSEKSNLTQEKNILKDKVEAFNKAGMTNEANELVRLDKVNSRIEELCQEQKRLERQKEAIEASYRLKDAVTNGTVKLD